jgi:arabinogalactan endo-1,4-beta-galactosidase
MGGSSSAGGAHHSAGSSGSSASGATQTGGSGGSGGSAPSLGTPFTDAQTLTGLDDGYYTLSASVTKSGAGNCYISVKDYGGGPERMTSLPVSTTPTTIVTRGVQVVGGQATIGFYQDADATDCEAGSAKFTRDDLQYQFLKGGDATEVTRSEASGALYRETDGTPADPFVILKNHGYNMVRLRLYNDPGNPDFSPSNQMPPYAGPADILALAKRAKAQGMMIELTFHYSDYWTNAGTQCLPHDWANLTAFADVKAAMANFTQDFMAQMAAQETTPEYVSIGNETNAGLLYPFGCAYVLQASPYCPTETCSAANWSQLGQLYGAAYDAVKAVSPSTQVIIHLAYDNGAGPAAAASSFNSYFNKIAQNGGKFDIKGLTYYPFWSRQTVSNLVSMVNLATAAPDAKPVIIMESGYNWNPTRQNGTLGQLTDDGPEPYPSTRQGQKDFLLDLYAGIKNVNGGRCIGNLYWDPTNIITNSQVSNTAMFDFSGKALPALDAAQFNN